MKPGNLRTQGAKSGGYVSADEETVARFVCDEALFLCQIFRKECVIYEHEENFYIRIRD